MEKEFSLTGFAEFLTESVVLMEHHKHHALDEAAKIVQEEAKAVLGTYDYGWPQLAQSTQEDRARQGYPDNEPGLRSGEMRESIKRSVGHDEALVGSNDQNLVYFDQGTRKQPPRPVLEAAAVRKIKEVVHALGIGALKGLVKSP